MLLISLRLSHTTQRVSASADVSMNTSIALAITCLLPYIRTDACSLTPDICRPPRLTAADVNQRLPAWSLPAQTVTPSPMLAHNQWAGNILSCCIVYSVTPTRQAPGRRRCVREEGDYLTLNSLRDRLLSPFPQSTFRLRIV